MPVLCGYVLPSDKVVQRWLESPLNEQVEEAVLIPARRNGFEGWLYASPEGNHALSAGEQVLKPSSTGRAGAWAALWLALDHFVAEEEDDLVRAFRSGGVDADRSGYARDACSADGVVYTVGSRGETEPERPQVWFARQPVWPCRVALSPAGSVDLGPPGPSGWPQWFRVGESDLLELTGPPRAPTGEPLWAVPEPQPDLLPPDPSPNWRGAFEHDRP